MFAQVIGFRVVLRFLGFRATASAQSAGAPPPAGASADTSQPATGVLPAPPSIGVTYFPGGIQAEFPYGGWNGQTYVYTPQFGFGRYGPGSWYYRGPYAYPYVLTPPTPLLMTPFGSLSAFPYGNLSLYHLSAWYPGPAAVLGSAALFPVGATARPFGDPYLTQLWLSAYQQGRSGGTQAPQQFAGIELHLQPGDAALYLDGNAIGTASSFSRRGAELRLPVGKHHLEAVLPGYEPFSHEVVVKAGQQLTITQQLRKRGESSPRLAPEDSPAAGTTSERPQGELGLQVTPGNAEVLLDGKFLCRGSSAAAVSYLHRLPAGPHRLEIRADGYRAVKEEIVISPLRALDREITLERR